MKILFLITFIFSAGAYAGFMSRADALDCEKSGRTFYSKKSSCVKNHADCTSVPNNFKCEHYGEADEMIDDIDKPNYSKSEIDSCLDATDCQSKLEAKICTDAFEQPIKNLTSLEVYCSKLTGYDQKLSGFKILKLDNAKKATHEAAELAKSNAENARKNKALSVKNKLKTLKWGAMTDNEKTDAINYILRNL